MEEEKPHLEMSLGRWMASIPGFMAIGNSPKHAYDILMRAIKRAEDPPPRVFSSLDIRYNPDRHGKII